MIANVTKMLDEIHRIYEPGMEIFFSRMTPDMWTKSVDDLEESIMDPTPEVALRAIAIYKYRRIRMVELYKGFKELTQTTTGRNPVIEAIQKNLYADATEQTTRRLVRCDRCQATPEASQSIRLWACEKLNNQDDPYVWISALCDQCSEKKGVA